MSVQSTTAEYERSQSSRRDRKSMTKPLAGSGEPNESCFTDIKSKTNYIKEEWKSHNKHKSSNCLRMQNIIGTINYKLA